MEPKTFLARLSAAIQTQPLLLIFVATFGAVAFLNSAKIGLALYGIAKLALFALAGDRVDEWIFRKPADSREGVALGTMWKRKAWIVSASIIVGGLLP